MDVAMSAVMSATRDRAATVRGTVESMLSAMASLHDERRLHDSLEEGLKRMRATYRSDRGAFAAADVASLVAVRDVVAALEDLIYLSEAVEEARTLDDYHHLRTLIAELERPLRGLAVAARLGREARALEEKRPALAAGSAELDYDRWAARRAAIERWRESVSPPELMLPIEERT